MKLLAIYLILLGFKRAVSASPSVTQFTVNKQTKDLTVPEDAFVKFRCRGSGRPAPTVTVRASRSNRDVGTDSRRVNSRLMEAQGTLIMQCKDTDTYTCYVRNDQGVAVKNVTVFVECELQFNPYFNLTTKTLKSKNTTIFTKDIRVMGFPAPAKFALARISRMGEEFPVEVFDVSSELGSPPFSTVKLFMPQLTRADSGSYKLTMTNGIGDGLNYTFKVLVGDSGKSTGRGNSTMGLYGVHWIGLASFVLVYAICFLACSKSEKEIHEDDDEDVPFKPRTWGARRGRTNKSAS